MSLSNTCNRDIGSTPHAPISSLKIEKRTSRRDPAFKILSENYPSATSARSGMTCVSWLVSFAVEGYMQMAMQHRPKRDPASPVLLRSDERETSICMSEKVVETDREPKSILCRIGRNRDGKGTWEYATCRKGTGKYHQPHS